MPEGAHPYPRWEGPMRTGSPVGIIAMQEVRRTVLNFWSQMVLLLVLAYTIVYLGQLFQSARGGASDIHTLKTYVDFLNDLRFGALAVGGLMAGPALLEDVRKGGLELYLSRAVTKWDYLVGKILAVFGIVTATMAVPAILYWLTTIILFKQHPDHWGLALAGALGYSLLWALFVSGVGLGISSVARSPLGAALLLIIGTVLLELFVVAFLQPITRQKILQLVSPLTALRAQTDWLFKYKSGVGFDYVWGLLVLGLLILVGWGLVAWKHPRVRGAEA
jgi:ABC-type transport system involved in multi-copper enzyme maturation permease subunit